MRRIVIPSMVLLVGLLTSQVGAQAPPKAANQKPASGTSLFVPSEIQAAYRKGTRSWDGTPGPRYWQNRSSYRIRASVNPATRRLTGQQTVTYFNQSPDTLNVIVLRTYPDLTRRGAARDQAIDPSDVDAGLELSRLTVGGAQVQARDQGSLRIVRLPKPLLPNSQVELDMSWSYTIPAASDLRSGTYADSSFLVAYWYPQVAVYDDIHGWDQLPFEGMVEFYNDFSDFDVEITMPRNHLVWATGEFQNPEQVLAEPYLSRYRQAMKSDQIVQIIQPSDLPRRNFTPGTGAQTWRFRQTNVTDFAFATSSTYLWDASSVVVDSSTQRRVTVGAAYQTSSRDFYHVAQFAREAVAYFSHRMPGVPFPFPSITIFNGQGGMEFPGLVNDGSFPTMESAAEVTAHEIAHTYFPFYMGINEKRYAWMDEGFAQFLPNEYEFTHPTTGAKFQVQGSLQGTYGRTAGRHWEMPLMVPSYVITGDYLSYAIHSYMRSGTMYSQLEDLLGKAEFKRVLQEYMRRWHGKHPTPYDFFQTFNTVSGQNLDWFFRPWAFEFGKPDLALASVRTTGNRTTIQVDRKGNIPVPVVLTVSLADGTTQTIRETAAVWKNGAASWSVTRSFGKPVQRVVLGMPTIPDGNSEDNTWTQGK